MKLTIEFEGLEDMKDFIDRCYVSDGRLKEERTAGTTQSASNQTSVAPVTPAVAPVAPVAQVMPATIPTPVTTPTVQAPVQSEPQTVAVSDNKYTLDELSRAAVTLMDAGKQGELLTLLQSFGVDALPQIPIEQYGAFATALRAKGAMI